MRRLLGRIICFRLQYDEVLGVRYLMQTHPSIPSTKHFRNQPSIISH